MQYGCHDMTQKSMSLDEIMMVTVSIKETIIDLTFGS